MKIEGCVTDKYKSFQTLSSAFKWLSQYSGYHMADDFDEPLDDFTELSQPCLPSG